MGLAGINVTIQYNLIQSNNSTRAASGDGIYADQYVAGTTSLVPSMVLIDNNTTYYVLSLEAAGGDQFSDYGPVSSTTAATVNGPA